MITIKSFIRDYPVVFEQSFGAIAESLKENHTVAIVDRKVHAIYQDHIDPFVEKEKLFLLDAVEENKSLEYVTKIYRFLLEHEAKRNLMVVTIGGGITQDIVGFAASTLYRGVGWVFFPTTLLAQTDSCIGSKTSINFAAHKNLLGTFYPPTRILINTGFLGSLSPLDFASGVGEAIKLQLLAGVWDEPMFKRISRLVRDAHEKPSQRQGLIEENLLIKHAFMAGDEFDTGRRNLLNYGHCFGHVIESLSSYAVPHGIAVLIGMAFANHLSCRRGILARPLAERVLRDLLLPNIPLQCTPETFVADKFVAGLKKDKKRTGSALSVIVPGNNGCLLKLTDVGECEVIGTLEDIKEVFLSTKIKGEGGFA